GLVDGAAGALADGVEHLEAADLLAGAGRGGGSGAGLQAEAGATRRAGDLLARADLDQLDGVAAVRAEDVHGGASAGRGSGGHSPTAQGGLQVGAGSKGRRQI